MPFYISYIIIHICFFLLGCVYVRNLYFRNTELVEAYQYKYRKDEGTSLDTVIIWKRDTVSEEEWDSWFFNHSHGTKFKEKCKTALVTLACLGPLVIPFGMLLLVCVAVSLPFAIFGLTIEYVVNKVLEA